MANIAESSLRKAFESVTPQVTGKGFSYVVDGLRIEFNRPTFIANCNIKYIAPQITTKTLIDHYNKWLNHVFDRMNKITNNLVETKKQLESLREVESSIKVTDLHDCILELSKSYLAKGGKVRALKLLFDDYDLSSVSCLQQVKDGQFEGEIFDSTEFTSLSIEETQILETKLNEKIEEMSIRFKKEMENNSKSINKECDIKIKMLIQEKEALNEQLEIEMFHSNNLKEELERLKREYYNVEELYKKIEQLEFRLRQQDAVIEKNKRLKLNIKKSMELNSKKAEIVKDTEQITSKVTTPPNEQKIDIGIYVKSAIRSKKALNQKSKELDKLELELKEISYQNKEYKEKEKEFRTSILKYDSLSVKYESLKQENERLRNSLESSENDQRLIKETAIEKGLDNNLDDAITKFLNLIKPGINLLDHYNKHLSKYKYMSVQYKGINMLKGTQIIAEKLDFQGAKSINDLFYHCHDFILLGEILKNGKIHVAEPAAHETEKMSKLKIGLLNLKCSIINPDGILDFEI